MTDAREVIANTLRPAMWEPLPNKMADAILSALNAAGYKVVGRTASDEMLHAYYACMEGSHPTAKMNPSKYLVHNLKASKRWAAMFDAAPPVTKGEEQI